MPLTRIQTDALQSAITSSNLADGTIVAADLASGAVTAPKMAAGAVENYMAASGANFMFRNKIINGDMQIDQRYAGATGTVGPSTSQDFRVDRFFVQRFGGTAVFSAARSTTAPPGFNYSLNINVTTAAAPSSSTDSAFIRTHIEGFNVADLAWGTPAAATVTLSFWVRSSVTGNYAGGITNGAPDRCYVFTYTISQANTWEYKTVTIPGDTSGTWNKDNTTGMRINFDLGGGTVFNGTAGVWAAGNAFRTSSTGTFMNNSGASFFITGVQLEAGSVATPFERRPFGVELALCQRYYETSYAFNTAAGASTSNTPQGGTFIWRTASTGWYNNMHSGSTQFKVQKRTTPTMRYWDFAGNLSKCGGLYGSSNLAIVAGSPVGGASSNGFFPDVNTAADATVFIYWEASSEL